MSEQSKKHHKLSQAPRHFHYKKIQPGEEDEDDPCKNVPDGVVKIILIANSLESRGSVKHCFVLKDIKNSIHSNMFESYTNEYPNELMSTCKIEALGIYFDARAIHHIWNYKSSQDLTCTLDKSIFSLRFTNIPTYTLSQNDLSIEEVYPNRSSSNPRISEQIIDDNYDDYKEQDLINQFRSTHTNKYNTSPLLRTMKHIPKPKQTIHNISHDSMANVLSFFNAEDRSRMKAVSKKFKFDVDYSFNRGFEYDASKTSNSNFSNFLTSANYEQCTSLILPDLWNTQFDLPKNLKVLKMNDYFSQNLFLPDGLISFTMGDWFNRPIDLPISLIHLKLGDEFNQDESLHKLSSLTSLNFFSTGFFLNKQISLPSSLTNLNLGYRFNQPLVLHEGMISFTMGETFNRPIDLPNSLTNLHLGSEFDQPLVLHDGLISFTMSETFNRPIDLPNSLTNLHIGYEFNQPLVLHEGLISLSMRDELRDEDDMHNGFFNRPINLPDSLKSLKLGDDFDQDLKLPKALTNFVMGEIFNRPVNLPSSLIEFNMGHSFNQPIEFLNNLVNLKLGYSFNQKVAFPDSLLVIDFGWSFNKRIKKLPDNLKVLNMGYYSCFRKQLPKIPSTLTKLNLSGLFNSPLDLSSTKITKLILPYMYNSSIKLPKTLQHLHLGSKFNQEIVFPDSLQSLTMDYMFNKHLNLPKNLKSFHMGEYFNTPIALPDSLLILQMGEHFNQPITFPPNLKELLIGKDFSQELILPDGLMEFTKVWKFDAPNIEIPSTFKLVETSDNNPFQSAKPKLYKRIEVVSSVSSDWWEIMLNWWNN